MCGLIELEGNYCFVFLVSEERPAFLERNILQYIFQRLNVVIKILGNGVSIEVIIRKLTTRGWHTYKISLVSLLF